MRRQAEPRPPRQVDLEREIARTLPRLTRAERRRLARNLVRIQASAFHELERRELDRRSAVLAALRQGLGRT